MRHLFALAILLVACRKPSMDSADAAAVATPPVATAAVDAGAVTAATATASHAPVTKAATPAITDGGKASTTALNPPTPTTDRFPRNRLKDGPCPAGFTEQPGVEERSSCARNCKKDADCNGHTCVDSDVGD